MSSPRDDAGLTEAGGKWLLPVGDGKVTQIQVDYAFTLVLESWISIRIETSFSYGPAGEARQFEPSDAPGLAPLLGLHQASVTSAEIRKDGRLTIAFAGGGELVVPPDSRYEAFTVTGSWPLARRGFSFTALPAAACHACDSGHRDARLAHRDARFPVPAQAPAAPDMRGRLRPPGTSRNSWDLERLGNRPCDERCPQPTSHPEGESQHDP